ncbi:lanthionine synthetase C family protein [Sphaerisporangium album]|nr:lanthionine synthetase C family protein [Sphaerisporangium album]
MMPHRQDAVRAVADAIADRLASPTTVRGLHLPQGWWPQSLAYGATGIALLHIERARAGCASWRHVHDWLACAAGGEILTGSDSHLFYGAPALGFAMNAASDLPGHYARARDELHRHIATTTRRRLDRAHARMDHGRLATLAEFDVIRGLAGIGAYLLRHEPHGELIRAVISYLVRLTEPVKDGGELLPGWWTDLNPAGRRSEDFAGGHGNNGVAHGVCGPLALLSLALRDGVVVDGHIDAIQRICAWLDDWRQDGKAGPWWPYWVTRTELREGHHSKSGPSRPSWCYGTAGLARAQQLTSLATGDLTRQRMAESALVRALTDPGQLAAITDSSLCHGYAGLVHIACRAATDAVTPDVVACLPRLLGMIIEDDIDADSVAASLLLRPGDPGLLEGAAGIALALHSAHSGVPPASGWDSCLLIS